MSDSFSTPWTVACQALLLMGFPRQEYWSGLPFPSSGDLPDPRIEPASPSLGGRFYFIVISLIYSIFSFLLVGKKLEYWLCLWFSLLSKNVSVRVLANKTKQNKSNLLKEKNNFGRGWKLHNRQEDQINRLRQEHTWQSAAKTLPVEPSVWGALLALALLESHSCPAGICSLSGHLG